jgi:hypothetical protein
MGGEGSRLGQRRAQRVVASCARRGGARGAETGNEAQIWKWWRRGMVWTLFIAPETAGGGQTGKQPAASLELEWGDCFDGSKQWFDTEGRGNRGAVPGEEGEAALGVTVVGEVAVEDRPSRGGRWGWEWVRWATTSSWARLAGCAGASRWVGSLKEWKENRKIWLGCQGCFRPNDFGRVRKWIKVLQFSFQHIWIWNQGLNPNQIHFQIQTS